MSFQKTALILALIFTIAPVVAVLLRGLARRLVALGTLLGAAAMAAHLGILYRLVELGPRGSLDLWVYLLAASATPLLLAGYLFSLSFGRDHAESAVRASVRSFVILGAIGMGFLAALRHPSFITGYEWDGASGTVRIGALGKAYLSYLLIGVVIAGYNLERTYRMTAAEGRYRLRLPHLGLFALLAYETLLLTLGLLYSSIGLGKLIAQSLPVLFASLAIAFGFLRGAIVDSSAPVSRNIIYSSFTALAAGLFVLAIAVAAQIATLTDWSPDEILFATFCFLAVLVGVLLVFSNRFQRGLRRFIDRNFYVNRYDYRTQWTALTRALEAAADRESILGRGTTFLAEVFGASAVTICLRHEAMDEIRPVRGKGVDADSVVLDPDSPLYRTLKEGRQSLLLDRIPHDLSYIAIYAENRDWLNATASRLVAPILDGDDLVGTIGLERSSRDDPFTYEDVSLLDSIAAHLSAAFRTVRLTAEVAEAREMELFSQWSSMVLHDLKNYLGPLRMIATNLVEMRHRPEITGICAQDINRVTDCIEKRVNALSDLRQTPIFSAEVLSPNQLVRDTLSSTQISIYPSIRVQLDLRSQQCIRGDREMLRRVLENLITNAIDAMAGSGSLTLRTEDLSANGSSKVRVEVADTGTGIPESFLRDRLFRPFATNKEKGLGLGLYQCRSIVRAHGGELRVRNLPGSGTVFEIVLAAAMAVDPEAQRQEGLAEVRK